MRKKMSNNSQATMTKELSDGIKNLLGKHVRILLKCAVKLESKGDKTENRVLVFCPCRFFCLKVPPRIDFHFHYLEIQAIESKKPNQLVVIANDKSHSFLIPDPALVENIDRMIVTLLQAVSETFPGIPIYHLVGRLDVVPANRLQHLDLTFDGGSSTSSGSGGSATTTPVPYPKSKSTSSLEENASLVSTHLNLNQSGSPSSSIVGGVGDRSTASMTPSNYHHVSCGGIGPCGGFSTQYAWMCDLHGYEYREEVSWDVDTIYLSNDSRELCLSDFDHLEQRDLVPILSALQYNNWFKGIRASNVKLSHEAMERLLHVVRKSLTIEELHLNNIGARSDFAHKLSAALSYNTNSQVHTIDFSHNMIEDKGAIHLSNPLAKLCRGPVWLNLSQCGLSSKGVAQLAHALASNRCAPNSLTHLNLSGNSLKDDINNLCNFLAQPNSISFLDLSGTDCTETIFGALLRGCTSSLIHLNLSRNNFASKKGKEIPPSYKQFLTSSLALKNLSLSSCKLSLEALKQLLLGLACNESTADLELDISSNCLGQQGAKVLEGCLYGVKCLASLDISDNNLDGDLAGVVAAASKNKSLKHLNLGRNLQSTKAKHVAQVMDAIVQMLQDEDCVLQTLSLADSKLKGEIFSVINALGSNQCLENLDISGNQMGDVGARLLAKALQINSKLRCINYDRNNITLQGFSDIAYGLESPSCGVRYMPFPIHDSLPCMKVSAEKTEAVMKRIQDFVYKNSLPKKTSNGQQAFRLQQGFLLSSAQQTVDKLISQTQEGVKLLRKNELNSPRDDSSHNEVITHAENLIADSEKAKQLLLSLHDMIEQKGESGKVIESKLQQLSDDFHTMLSQHIQGNIDNVLELTKEKCPSLIGDETLKLEIKQGCIDKSNITPDFVRHCMDMAGTDIVNKLNEVHLAVAAHISDKLVDRAIDSLMKCHKQINDVGKKRSSTPDVLKTRTTSFEDDSRRQFSDKSPTATPQMQLKRKGLNGRRIRPKSVVDCVEGISADDIPDLLPSLPKTIEETISSLQDLPPVSPQQLKHLGKARPRKPKTRAPTRLRPPTEFIEEVADLQEGLDTFFRAGSTTPTPIVTPDSDECSTSLMISMATSNADDSIQSTPTHSSRTFKVDLSDDRSDKTSPGSFDSCSISSKLSLDPVPRSKSTDCLEKAPTKRESLFAPGSDDGSDEQQSPVQKIAKSPPQQQQQPAKVSMGSSVLAEIKARQEKRTSISGFFTSSTKADELSSSITITNSSSSPITTGVSVSEAKEKFASSQKNTTSSSSVNRRPPPVAAKPKPRPWSVVDRRSGEYSLGSDGSSPVGSAANTPDSGDILDDNSTEQTTGKISPSTLNVAHNQSHHSVLEKFSSALSSSASSTVETASLPPASSSPSNHHHIVNQNQAQPISLVHPGSGGSNHAVSGAISIHLRNSDIVTGNDHSVSPVSLPVWGGGEKRSVRELAASLARQSNQQDSDPKKKSDSLPRNVPAASSTEQPDFNRARVSIQEWSRHHSISEVWKVPLRKLSADKPISKRWDQNNDQKTTNGLRNDEDVVNV